MPIETASYVQRALSLGLVLIAASGCSGSSSDGSNTSVGGNSPGGVASTGGTVANGGAAQGGAPVTGGAANTGGQVTMGGSPSTGGVSPTGGALATGGSQVSPTGGKSSTSVAPTGGAAPTGGKATGGTTSTNSSAPTGGKATGGAATGGKSSVGGAATGGKATGGSSANGGASATGGANAGGSSGTQGCGLSPVPAACSTAGSPCTMDVSGTARTYYVYLPSGYNASQKYPLVFQFHPMGGTAEQAINMPSIRNNFTAIYVTPQGLTANGNTGWANTNGVDITFTKQMVATVESSYCVDTARIFSTGFSYGGMMSFAVGCEMSNVFRAIAPMSGALYSDFNCRGTGPAIAMWGSHGLSDTVVPIADGRTARDKILQQNHCGTTTTATTPSPCVSYDGCDSGYPATWCEFDGGHQIPNFANSAIAAFFKTF